MILPDNIPYLRPEAERENGALYVAASILGHTYWSGPVVAEAIRRRRADLSLHESRFIAARWLESTGRPGWRFLDGPGPLTAEQSARVLHEACLRARDGATAIVGVLGPWRQFDASQFYARPVIVSAAFIPSGTAVLGYDRASTMPEADERCKLAGWFCL